MRNESLQLPLPGPGRDAFFSVYRRGETIFKTVLTPRVILAAPGGDFPLVQYKAWHGLPGGKIKKHELDPEENLLTIGAFPTLVREVREECGIDFSSFLEKCTCLGIAQVSEVIGEPNSAEKIIHRIAPIFYCPVPEEALANLREDVIIANLNDHLAGPLFPDARVAISYLKRSIRERRGPIIPEFINGEDGIYFFQTRPKVNLLMGHPPWF